jgi:two-component system, OmpR family, response regulator RegX3
MFEVVTANSYDEGIAAARLGCIQVILLDLAFPDEDGWGICQEIRKSCDAPIILLSAWNKPGLIERALDAGADEILMKPVPAGILMAHLKRLTRRAQAEKAAYSSRNGDQKGIHP